MKEKIIKIISEEACINKKEIKLSSTLDSLGLDSLDGIVIVQRIEELTDRIIPDKDWEKLKTVGDVVKYINIKNGLQS